MITTRRGGKITALRQHLFFLLREGEAFSQKYLSVEIVGRFYFRETVAMKLL